MKHFRRAFSRAGILASISYALFTMAAYLQFPSTFTPTNHWLSDLGDVHQNPLGASMYNLGIFLTGILIILFFLSFSEWKMNNHRIQTNMVWATQIFGVMGSICLTLSAVYPLSQIEQHRIWSVSMYILLGTAFVFSVAALRYQPQYPAWVLALGGMAGLVDIFSGIFSQATVLEWLTVTLFLVYLLVLSVTTNTWAKRRLAIAQEQLS